MLLKQMWQNILKKTDSKETLLCIERKTMVKDIYERICSGEDVRANLLCLKEAIREEKARREFARVLSGDFRRLEKLLQDKDAKIRKNAALILGELESEDVLPCLYQAYQRETQLFVRESYLKAMEKLNVRPWIPELKRRQKELAKEIEAAPEEKRKHLRVEAAVLSRILLKYEKPVSHTFIGLAQADVILICNRNNREITARQIQTGTIFLMAGGVHVKGASLEEIGKIRTWQELLFPLHGGVVRENTPEAAAQTVWNTDILEILQESHTGKGPFRFRMEYKGSMEEQKKTRFIKKAAILLEELSGRQLINCVSDYEVEIRLVESKKGGYLPLLKLGTMEDKRFAYRREVIAASIAPVNAALIMQIAGDYLKENAQVLDPCCGVGTMLIERKYFRLADPLYGVDIFGEGIQKAKENSACAGMPIHYITRDYFTFAHDYLFDELITDLPPAADEKFYQDFFAKSWELLKNGAILVLYNRKGELLERMCRSCQNLQILKTAILNERQNSMVIVGRFCRKSGKGA